MRVLVTCPPMLRNLDEFRPRFERHAIDVEAPEVVQTLMEPDLIRLVPGCDGWIIGDDPATRAVFTAGKAGSLKAAVKWGVGVDNVDLEAARALGIAIANTPCLFGNEVADLAVGYVTALARQFVAIDRGVRDGGWPKPSGISLAGRTVALVGYGDIGRNTARRLLAAEMRVLAYDPVLDVGNPPPAVEVAVWPERVEEADFIVLSCALTPETRHLLDSTTFSRMRPGVRVVNVARGALIDESALVMALESGQVSAAALDVFEEEPLPADSPMRRFDRCILGSHNGSNTVDAVRRASERAIELLFGFLGGVVSAVQNVKTAIVTGAAGGIGAAVCAAFGQAGYRVIGCDLREGAPNCDVFLQFDLRAMSSSASDRHAVLGRIREALGGGGVDALVNNAAVQLLGPADALTADDWRATLDVNLLAPFLLTQGLLPELERAGGSVVNVASIHAHLTKPGFVAYATSKAALVGLTRSLAVDLGGRVRVNAVLPAATATPMLLAGLGPGEVDAVGAMQAMGRIARPEEIAAAVVYLASGAASFVSGAVLAVDGGMGGRLHDPA